MSHYEPEMVAHFESTNHAGLRLTWYFDLKGQATRAHKFATQHAASAQPTELAWDELSALDLDDDFITDAGEFARWLTGNDVDDGLADADGVWAYVVWGEDPDEGTEPDPYWFKTEAEREAFLRGVSEAQGWQDYTVVDSMAYTVDADGEVVPKES